MFKLPSILPYPSISPISEQPTVVNQFCYVIEAYEPGLAIVVKLDQGHVGVAIGDWLGNSIGPGDKATDVMPTAHALANIMGAIGIDQAQFFIAGDGTLVDVQVSLNRFIGPGMLRDIFAKVVDTQHVDEVTVLSQDKLNALKATGKHFVFKPSKFKTDSESRPLYARI